MTYFDAVGIKIRRSKADVAPTCQQIAKEMPYDVVNLNPQKVGSDSEPSRGRLQPNRHSECDFL